jgi:monoamine oxidase
VLARTFDNSIYFAGEATESATSGTVEGALVSGRRAAQKVLAASRR